jgi:hypothetical protein
VRLDMLDEDSDEEAYMLDGDEDKRIGRVREQGGYSRVCHTHTPFGALEELPSVPHRDHTR